jgi:hypothetical protein
VTDNTDADIEIAPFFSPEWSAKTLTQIIQEVPDDGYVDVGTPCTLPWGYLGPQELSDCF